MQKILPVQNKQWLRCNHRNISILQYSLKDLPILFHLGKAFEKLSQKLRLPNST